MSSPFWDERYATDDYIFGTAPKMFLASQVGLIRSGMRALAIADGEGRNGVWLAGEGAYVHAIDVSLVALEPVAFMLFLRQRPARMLFQGRLAAPGFPSMPKDAPKLVVSFSNSSSVSSL